MNPLITVITLAFNSSYLLDSIRSVLDQTYPSIQYLIVDDGSSDFNKAAVCSYIEQHKKKNIVEYEVIVNRQNLGTVRAFNLALKKANGDFIFNLAADDLFYDTEVLKEWTAEFLKRDSLFMLGRIAAYDSDLKEFKQYFPSPKEVRLLLEGDTKKIFHALAKDNFVLGCGTARSRKLLQICGYFDEDFFLLEDHPYALKITRHSIRIDYWDRPVVRYRLGGVSAPHNFNSIYEKDADLNFRKEILPYMSHPFIAALEHRFWKYNRLQTGKFTTAYHELIAEGKRYLLPFLIFKFPLPVLRGIKNRLKRITRNIKFKRKK